MIHCVQGWEPYECPEIIQCYQNPVKAAERLVKCQTEAEEIQPQTYFYGLTSMEVELDGPEDS